MKTHHLNPASTVLLAALAFGTATVAVPAQSPGTATPMNLEVATPQSEVFALHNLTGKSLQASNHEQLSTIADFLIDPKTGQVPFAVAPSGGGAQGETYRIIPMSALTVTPSADTFTLSIDRAKWDLVGTLVESRLRGKISINEEHQNRLAQQFSMPPPANTAGALELVRASELRGRELRSGNEQLGTIEDIVIDVNNHRAAPLLNPSGGFAASGRKFLVPFTQLQLADQPTGAITTTLSRADFERLQPGMPTGQSSAMFGQHQSIRNAMTAVQQAFSRDQSLAGAGIQVIPEGRLVLRGTVDNAQKRSDAERAAQQAAPGVRIDNEITVRNW